MDQINTDLKCDERGIFYFGDYLNKVMGGVTDPYTRKIHDLKARSSDAVAYFSGIMHKSLVRIHYGEEAEVVYPGDQPLDSFADLVISFVPSSNSENIKTGLYDLLDAIKGFNEWVDPMCSVAPNAFIRHTTIPKSQARDRRNYEIHYNSISMNMNANVFTAEGTTVKLDAGMPLLIIDDVSTTGTSLLALRKIAIRNGFKRAYLLALGRTKSRND